jgi:capsular exopolysaccharide synthesis family protein
LDSLPEKELTLRELLAIFRRRRKIIYVTFLTFAVSSALYCAVCTRRYLVTGTLQVQKESADAMGLDSLMSGGDSASDALGANINLQTQANILQSDTLALRTIEGLRLEDTKDFKPHWNPVSAALGVFSPAGAADPPNTSLENSPQRRRRVLRVFQDNLKVKPVGGTRIIQIEYLSSDPKLAAAVVNKLMQSLVDYTFQTRYDATNQASQWLSSQLGELRQSSEDLQAKVVRLEKESGVYSLGTTDAQGRQQGYSGVLDRLQQATVALSAAEQNRILKGAVAHAAQTGDAEMLSGLAGNQITGQSQAVANSLSLIQNLRQQEATQRANLQEMEAKFGPDYPKVAEVSGSLAGLDRSLHQEIDRVKGRAQSDYQIAEQTESGLKQKYDASKVEADKLNDKAVEYTIVQQEAAQSRGLYEDLLKRLKEAGVLAGLKSSNITVIDSGRATANPTKPNIPLYMAIALGSGFFFGCCGALLVDTLDNKIISIAALEELTGQSVLGALPFAEESHGASHVILLKAPQSPYAEAMRSIRTALLLWQSETPPKVILVTSSIAGEGKSALSVNLAAVLAQHGRRVLVVDADLRRGTLRKRFNLTIGPGLSGLLSGQYSDVISPVESVAGLDAIQAGIVPPNPSELLDSDAMHKCLTRWRMLYDFVILDGAPVLPVTDSVSLNALADATLMVVRNGVTEKPQVKRSYQTLIRSGKHPVGLVLNGLRIDDSNYYGYYGYKKDKYKYGGDNDA